MGNAGATAASIAGSMFGLIFLYLVLKNPKAINDLLSTANGVTNRQIAALQGR